MLKTSFSVKTEIDFYAAPFLSEIVKCRRLQSHQFILGFHKKNTHISAAHCRHHRKAILQHLASLNVFFLCLNKEKRKA